VLLAAAPNLPVAALCVLCAHFGGSILWVFSTVLLQMEVPDKFRGRVFAAELAFVTLTSSISSYLTAFALDRAGWSPRMLAFSLGAMFCIPGLLWLGMLSRWRQDEGPLERPAETASGEEEVLESRVG
jgi:MFS family permease